MTLACVTGASGFIGTHVVRELLERGYRVRGTVRDPSDDKKTAHLARLAEGAGAGDRLELVAADLLAPEAFDAAVAGCEMVFHVASPVALTAEDPRRDIVEPALEGTENVFAAVNRAGGVIAVGLTSSIAAVTSKRRRPEHVYTERDWAEDATIDSDPYAVSKRLAERAAWRARDVLPEERRYSMTVVNPVVVTGPIYARGHVRSSTSIIRDIMRGTYRGCPDLGFGVVDVRDVASALVGGVEARRTGRYILADRFMWMREIAEVLDHAFPELEIPTRRLPNFLVYAAALFDKRLTWSYLRRTLGYELRFDNRKSRDELGVEYRDMRQSLIDTAESLLEHRLVKK